MLILCMIHIQHLPSSSIKGAPLSKNILMIRYAFFLIGRAWELSTQHVRVKEMGPSPGNEKRLK